MLRKREPVGLDTCSSEPSASLEALAGPQSRLLVGGSLAALSVLCPKTKVRSEGREHNLHILYLIQERCSFVESMS